MKYERDHGSHLTPAELYAKIPVVHPTVTEVVTTVKPEKGIYKVRSVTDFNNFPVWSWEQIYNFTSR